MDLKRKVYVCGIVQFVTKALRRTRRLSHGVKTSGLMVNSDPVRSAEQLETEMQDGDSLALFMADEHLLLSPRLNILNNSIESVAAGTSTSSRSVSGVGELPP
ncbi:hypothetical protein KOW79_002116 [Hemibagrus wyckioides]|uniref:Uncharacterized protein n=1 Tax=Hemibagrus wyckioides TaxID=337641 RepID=A0A9D3SVW5_9TELE|nr:hypothetical protein KOW79_002116 [Hemibagrus wyckioides]